MGQVGNPMTHTVPACLTSKLIQTWRLKLIHLVLQSVKGMTCRKIRKGREVENSKGSMIKFKGRDSAPCDSTTANEKMSESGQRAMDYLHLILARSMTGREEGVHRPQAIAISLLMWAMALAG